MCCVMGYTGHDLSAAKFKEYLLRTVMRGPDDQRVVEGPFGLMGFGLLFQYVVLETPTFFIFFFVTGHFSPLFICFRTC